MKQKINRYKIFGITIRDYAGYGINEESKIFFGYQYAVSEAQAVSRFAYKNGIKSFDMCDMWGDGLCTKMLIAELDKEQTT